MSSAFASPSLSWRLTPPARSSSISSTFFLSTFFMKRLRSMSETEPEPRCCSLTTEKASLMIARKMFIRMKTTSTTKDTKSSGESTRLLRHSAS